MNDWKAMFLIHLKAQVNKKIFQAWLKWEDSFRIGDHMIHRWAAGVSWMGLKLLMMKNTSVMLKQSIVPTDNRHAFISTVLVLQFQNIY